MDIQKSRCITGMKWKETTMLACSRGLFVYSWAKVCWFGPSGRLLAFCIAHSSPLLPRRFLPPAFIYKHRFCLFMYTCSGCALCRVCGSRKVEYFPSNTMLETGLQLSPCWDHRFWKSKKCFLGMRSWCIYWNWESVFTRCCGDNSTGLAITIRLKFE